MPILYSGTLVDGGREYTVKCILGKDIKINLYTKPETKGLRGILENSALGLSNLVEKPTYDLTGSYLTFVEKNPKNKKFERKTLLYGDVQPAHRILELVYQHFIVGEKKYETEYPSSLGVVHEVEYEKILTNGKIHQIEKTINGILNEIQVEEVINDKTSTLVLIQDGKAPLTPTKGINYHESKFDIGNVKENAIHSQVRSIQHLRNIRNLGWIDKLIEQGNFTIVDELETLKKVVNGIKEDLKKSREQKIYYDTEGTGLNIFDLPPDHPEFDMMAAHVISWVKERREDGYPLDVRTIVVPVGMKYCDNVDEIEAIEVLRTLLMNPEIGVVSHNADYEIQINLRYSEVENKLSYRKYYKWLKEMEAKSHSMDREYVEKRLSELEKEYEEKSKGLTGLAAKLRLGPLKKEIEELRQGLNVEEEIERVRRLDKEDKPYLSDIVGEDIFRVNIKYDTLVLSRMANNGGLMKDGKPFLRHRLEVLTENYLGWEQLSLDDIYGNSKSSKYKIYDFSLLPREFLLYYACPDTYVMPFVEWHLERQVYENMLELGATHEQAYKANLELLNLYYNVDTPFACHMAEFANYKGIAIDKQQLDEEKMNQEQTSEIILRFLDEITGEEIEWTKDRQVKPLVFEKFRYPVIFTTDKDERSYNKSTRMHHKSQTKKDHEPRYNNVVPIPEMKEDLLAPDGSVIISKDTVNELQCPISYIYQEFMDRYKDLTSFTKMIYERTYFVNGEWIYFPSYISTSTDTGRAAGGIMIMKDSKKGIFRARRGSRLLGGDLDQAELRLIANMSGDMTEIRNFRDPRYDPHTKTAADVNNIEQTEVSSAQRNAAKVINFGYAYGMGAKAAAENIYKELVPVPKPLILKTAILLKEFARANPVKEAWLNKLRKTTVDIGYSKTPMGRYKWFPETRNPDTQEWELARAGRQGGNVPIQGFCADYIKQRIVMVYEVIKECNITRYFSNPLFIHDETHNEVAEEAFKNAENKVYTKEMVKKEQQFNLLWLYDLMYSTFTEKPLGLDYLEFEAPMTMGIGLADTWEKVKSDLYGCPQELQIEIINKYRQGNIPDELHQGLCTDPVGTMLDQIRQWWAKETIKELEKGGIDPLNIPHWVGNHIEDLFIKRGLKDIFPVEKEELAELGLDGKDYLTAQVMKAVSYVRGEKVNIIESLESDKFELHDDYVEDSILSEVIDLSLFRKMKEELKDSYSEMDKTDYDYIFSESNLLQFGKLMVSEDFKELEINIDGMLSQSVVELEKLIRQHDGTGVYKVVIVGRRSKDINPYRVINTTYKVHVNEDLLLKIRSIMKEDNKRSNEIEKHLVRRVL